MYQQKDLKCVTMNILVKYESSCTHCLKFISKVKVSDRTTRQKDEMTDSCKYRFRLYTNKKQAYPPNVSGSMI